MPLLAGAFRSGSLYTDKKFTGQRLDGTGLYFYNARYYDSTIGRFISPDPMVPSLANPQAFNRYSYVLNNPLKYTDPSGHQQQALVTVAQTLSQTPGLGWLAGGIFVAAVAIEAYNATQESFNFVDIAVDVIGDVWNAGTDWFSETFLSPPDPYRFASKGHTTSIIIDFPYSAELYPVERDIISTGGTICLSQRTTSEKIKDIKANPGDWERGGEPKVEPATGRKYRGMTSVRETYTHKQTEETLDRHTIYDQRGRIVHEHWAEPKAR